MRSISERSMAPCALSTIWPNSPQLKVEQTADDTNKIDCQMKSYRITIENNLMAGHLWLKSHVFRWTGISFSNEPEKKMACLRFGKNVVETPSFFLPKMRSLVTSLGELMHRRAESAILGNVRDDMVSGADPGP